MISTDGRPGRFSIELVVFTALNSVISVPMLAISRQPNINSASLTPNFSRIKSASPFRLITVRRIPISCVIARRIVMGISVKRIGYPRFAPAIEYVATPPASLSAIAVIVAGPITDTRIIILRHAGERRKFFIE
jgi:hypothetical protein